MFFSYSQSLEGHDTLSTSRRRSEFRAKDQSNMATVRTAKARSLFARKAKRGLSNLGTGCSRISDIVLHEKNGTGCTTSYGQQHEQQRQWLLNLKCYYYEKKLMFLGWSASVIINYSYIIIFFVLFEKKSHGFFLLIL